MPPSDVGTLERVEFEYSAAPPRSLLRWLVEHPSELRRPKYTVSADASEKREKLLAGDPVVLAEAIDAIVTGRSHRGKWWCFEGTTMVDCALFTSGMPPARIELAHAV